jgi:DNA-binding NtrC family response regulator
VRVRRPVPGAKGGPPWWEITFVPLESVEGSNGFLGWIDVIQPVAPGASRKIPSSTANARLRQSQRFSFDHVVGDTTAGRHREAIVRLAAKTLDPIWITGPSGSGKETVARIIHHNSLVRERAFVTCDCRGIQPYLLDSLLFGIAGVATTGRAGTLFLKEPTVLPRDAQQRILDWLRIAPHPPRLICASFESANAGAKSGKLLDAFAADWSTIRIDIPALSERIDELSVIVERMGFRVAPGTIAALECHVWPGNLAELHETLALAEWSAQDALIGPNHLTRFVRERALLAANPISDDKTKSLDVILESVERRMIEAALARTKGNQTEAAVRLGIARARLGRRIEALKISS